jgi:transcriptional regulator with XRE-family HTH domain
MNITVDQLGKWLADVREKAGLSQAAAGRKIEKDSGQLSKWENGVKEMGAVTLLRLLQVCGAERKVDVIHSLSLMLGADSTYLGVPGDVNQSQSGDVKRPAARGREPQPLRVPHVSAGPKPVKKKRKRSA